MTRRDALLRLATLFGGTVFGAHRLLAAAPPGMDAAHGSLPAGEDLRLLEEVAETILPATPGSGGAKAAGLGDFMREVARDFYDEPERALLLAAPGQFNMASAERYAGRRFLELTPEERIQLLLALDQANPQPDHYRMVKQLTLWGYWTSEIGTREARNYLPVPGTFQGCLPMEPGTKAWSG